MYDLIMVGTSFASSFFLAEYLKKSDASRRVLALERGRMDRHAWQVENRSSSSTSPEGLFVNKNENKPWFICPAFGGGSNNWEGCCPRMLPNDFRLKSRYGVGRDWPLSYDELEEYYCRAEEEMEIAGPEKTPFPRSRPYPQPAHRMTDPDRLLRDARPGLHISQPTARARVKTSNRPACEARNVCNICPIDAKFTVLNGMSKVYQDPRVTLLLEANVMTVEYNGNVATGVSYVKDGATSKAEGDLVVLGAGALFNPFILLKSGIEHPLTGKGLCEQVSILVTADLDGVDSFQGSTSYTANGYLDYDGDHRSQSAACMTETSNIATTKTLRAERNKWRRRAVFKFIFEDIPQERNHVKISEEDENLPETVYAGHSDYTQRALDALPEMVPRFLDPLPLENYKIADKIFKSDAHIIGTTVMGDDPVNSVIDRHLAHHRIRNLVVLGSGAFPAMSPANPTLTIAALSLWSADKLTG